MHRADELFAVGPPMPPLCSRLCVLRRVRRKGCCDREVPAGGGLALVVPPARAAAAVQWKGCGATADARKMNI